MGERERRERKVARRHGGRAQPASGALWGMKNDVRKVGSMLLEHKETSSPTYRFDIRDFIQLELHCSDPLPVFLVEFTGRGSLYILPGWVDVPTKQNITTQYFSIGLDPVQHLGTRVEFPKAGKTVVIVGLDGYRQASEA